MAKSESTKVSQNDSSGLLWLPEEQFWRTVWWNEGRLTHDHVGIIFIILVLSHVLSTLLYFSLGNSFGVFSFDLT